MLSSLDAIVANALSRYVALVAILAGCGSHPSGSIQFGRVHDDDLAASPIPEAWILEGKPKARIKVLARSADSALTTALWDCTAGTFRWRFGADEVVHILEGDVSVTTPNGTQRLLRPGDVAYFNAGTVSDWHVRHYVKKLALVRRYNEPFMVRAQRKLNTLFAALPRT